MWQHYVSPDPIDVYRYAISMEGPAMPIDGENIPVWLDRLDAYFGNKPKRPQGRPKAPINEELLIYLKKEGCSNRSISRIMGYNRRTVDRRVILLTKEGRI